GHHVRPGPCPHGGWHSPHALGFHAGGCCVFRSCVLRGLQDDLDRTLCCKISSSGFSCCAPLPGFFSSPLCVLARGAGGPPRCLVGSKASSFARFLLSAIRTDWSPSRARIAAAGGKMSHGRTSRISSAAALS